MKFAVFVTLLTCVVAAVYCTPAGNPKAASVPALAEDPSPAPPTPEPCQQEGLKRGDKSDCRTYLVCKDGHFVAKSCWWPWKFDSQKLECVLYNAQCAA